MIKAILILDILISVVLLWGYAVKTLYSIVPLVREFGSLPMPLVFKSVTWLSLWVLFMRDALFKMYTLCGLISETVWLQEATIYIGMIFITFLLLSWIYHPDGVKGI